jgi:hypothetical protein
MFRFAAWTCLRVAIPVLLLFRITGLIPAPGGLDTGSYAVVCSVSSRSCFRTNSIRWMTVSQAIAASA